MKQIVVIDGQGGGIGAALVGRLRAALGREARIIGAGTNSLATSAMLKAGASKGATGENAVCWNAGQAGVILGPIGIVVANSLMGEISPAVAAAVSASPAVRILIPMSSCGTLVAGSTELKLEDALTDAVALAVREAAR